MSPETLRGEPNKLVYVYHRPSRVATYSARVDGSRRGRGYFGAVAVKGDVKCFATELPVTIGGILIPLIIPSLSRDELAHLVAGGDPTQPILRKAVDHAGARLGRGLSPFSGPREARVPLPRKDRYARPQL